MKTTVSGLALAAALLTPAAALAQAKTAPAVVVVVDTSRILRECTACVAANGQLQTQLTQIQQRAQALGTPLETEANAIRTELAGKAPTAAQQQRIQGLQQRQATAQQELQGREQTFNRNRAYVAQQVNAKLGPIITQAMNSHGANLAVDQGATLAASASIDITNEVLATLNQQLPSVSTTAPAQAAQPSRPAQQTPQGR